MSNTPSGQLEPAPTPTPSTTSQQDLQHFPGWQPLSDEPRLDFIQAQDWRFSDPNPMSLQQQQQQQMQQQRISSDPAADLAAERAVNADWRSASCPEGLLSGSDPQAGPLARQGFAEMGLAEAALPETELHAEGFAMLGSDVVEDTDTPSTAEPATPWRLRAGREEQRQNDASRAGYSGRDVPLGATNGQLLLGSSIDNRRRSNGLAERNGHGQLEMNFNNSENTVRVAETPWPNARVKGTEGQSTTEHGEDEGRREGENTPTTTANTGAGRDQLSQPPDHTEMVTSTPDLAYRLSDFRCSPGPAYHAQGGSAGYGTPQTPPVKQEGTQYKSESSPVSLDSPKHPLSPAGALNLGFPWQPGDTDGRQDHADDHGAASVVAASVSIISEQCDVNNNNSNNINVNNSNTAGSQNSP